MDEFFCKNNVKKINALTTTKDNLINDKKKLVNAIASTNKNIKSCKNALNTLLKSHSIDEDLQKTIDILRNYQFNPSK